MKQMNSLPMAGPLQFHPTQDIISIYYLKGTAKDQYMGTWIDIDFGTQEPFVIPSEDNISSLRSRSRPRTTSASEDEFDSAERSSTIIMDRLGDATFPIVDNRFFGNRPVWGPSRQGLMRYYPNQVAFIHRGTMYIASGDPNSAEPILFQDMTRAGPAVMAEMSQICHAPVQLERAEDLNASLLEVGIFRAPLLGDETFMVQIGFTHVHVWCFDDDVPLANEVFAYAHKAKKWAEDRAMERQWTIYRGEMRGLARPVTRLLSPWSMVHLRSAHTPTPSMVAFPSEPEPSELLGTTNGSLRAIHGQQETTGQQELGEEQDDPDANRAQAFNKRAKKHSIFRRGFYRLVVKVLGRIL